MDTGLDDRMKQKISISNLGWAALFLAVACSPQTQEISTSSDTYQKAVNDFRVSLAASQTDESRFAFNKMNDVVLAYPQEAAAWANLGVMAMRQGNRDLSVSRFERALQEQPDHPDILWLFGDAQSRFGASEEAVSYFEQAIVALTQSQESAETPVLVLTESLARFRYLSELERLDPVANQAQIQAEFETLRVLESENIAFWTEWAQYAAQQNDLEVLLAYTEKLQSWTFLPTQAQSFIPQLEKALSDQSTQGLGLQLSLLRSQIEPLERFQRDLARIALPVNDVGFLMMLAFCCRAF
jgi:tetratricopeptide (TPR) repeat protein